MNIFNLFKPTVRYISGVLPDERPQEEKNKDYKTEEILATATPLTWITWEEWKAKPENIKILNEIEVNNQNVVGSCAAETGSLILAINNYLEDKKFIKTSARAIYARRINKPNRGMYLDDVAKIMTTHGTVPEVLFPSPHTSEEAMSNLDDWFSLLTGIGQILKAKNYFLIGETNNIDRFAQVLALNKPLFITVVFGDGEFGEIAPIIKPVVPKYGHAITGLPNAYFTYQGKKAILIQNSWGAGVGYGGRQILTEDWFLNNRIVYGAWFEDMNNLAIFNQTNQPLPKYQWTRDLTVGSVGEDVRMLQIVLSMIQDENGFLFPLFTQNPTGYFGGITRQAIKRFQLKYGIEPAEGYFGIKTREKLNELCK